MTPQLGGDIDENWFSSNYDHTVQAALASSSNTYVIIDLVRPGTVVGSFTVLGGGYANSTTTPGGTAKSSVKVAQRMTSSRRSGRSWPRSTARTTVSFCEAHYLFVKEISLTTPFKSGIMNEPHDLPDVATWVDSVQFVVNAIRQAGAQNFLLLPGSSFSSAGAFPTEAGPLLVKVTDPLGDTSKLIFDGKVYARYFTVQLRANPC